MNVLLMLLVGIAIIALATGLMYFGNRQTVEPRAREAVVMYDGITGIAKVARSGLSFWPPEYKELKRVDLNREPIIVPDGNNTSGEEFRTANGVMGLVGYRYDIVVGRRYDKTTGQIAHYNEATNDLELFPGRTGRIFDNLTHRWDGDPDHPDLVDDESIIQAVTAIDFSDHAKRVADIVSVAVEKVLNAFHSRRLLQPTFWVLEPLDSRGVKIAENAPERATALRVPQDWFPVADNGAALRIIAPRDNVLTTQDLFEMLSACIEVYANSKLTFVGLNILDFRINNMKPVDQELQRRYEQKERTLAAALAARQYLAEHENSGLSFQQALVITDPEAFAQVTAAEAEKLKAQAEELKAQNWGAAAVQVAQAIEGGLKDFGRGS